jgi:hypothetical protein
MPRKKIGNHLIAYEEDGIVHKVCRILFGRDGSYYVTSPYHRTKTALLLKSTVNYNRHEQAVAIEESVDIAVSDDEEGRIKLAHHFDGFVQFSGKNVLSGIDRATGEIKGIGVQSFALNQLVRGPTFAITFTGVDQFEPLAKSESAQYAFKRDSICAPQAKLTYFLEGHVLPALWMRFVELKSDELPVINISHPAGAVIRLRVVSPPDDWRLPYFLGLEFYALQFEGELPAHSFILSGPTGNPRRNDKGVYLGTVFTVCTQGTPGLKAELSISR